MPIRCLTPMQSIQNYVQKEFEREEMKIIEMLFQVGEECAIHARNLPSPPVTMRGTPHTPNYIDDTGNLRSSIGYVVIKDGVVVKQGNFEQAKGGEQGASAGETFANSLVSKFPNGICLIVVAGMNYAAYVSAKGYDVLDSSEDLAERLIPSMMKQLGLK